MEAFARAMGSPLSTTPAHYNPQQPNTPPATALAFETVWPYDLRPTAVTHPVAGHVQENGLDGDVLKQLVRVGLGGEGGRAVAGEAGCCKRVGLQGVEEEQCLCYRVVPRADLGWVGCRVERKGPRSGTKDQDTID